MKRMILVTGATGNAGSAVAHALVEAGEPVRGLVRAGSEAALADGVEAAVGDLNDADSVAPALDGVSGVFMLSGSWLGWRARRASAAFDFALAGALAAAITRHPAPLAVAGPFAVLAARDAERWGTRFAAANVAANAVGAAALAYGSARARSLLL